MTGSISAGFVLMKRTLSCFLIALLVATLGIVATFAVQIVQIQFRLSRNGATGKQLVESLEKRFPGTAFRSAASYQSELISITVLDAVDEATKREIEQWLRTQKAERGLSLEIWLRLAPDEDLMRVRF